MTTTKKEKDGPQRPEDRMDPEMRRSFEESFKRNEEALRRLAKL